ncbi:MAG: acetyl-CoA hydrolase/transferase family protein [Bacteroidia bacterium]
MKTLACSTAQEALSLLPATANVFIHTAAATPKLLVEAMAKEYERLEKISVYSLHTEWEATYLDEPYADKFQVHTFFVGGNIRKKVWEGKASYIPMFLHEIPRYIRSGLLPIDVALVTLSPPDKRGFCSLGVSVDTTKAACEQAKYIIAEINPNMPQTIGDGLIHISQVSAFIEADYPIFEAPAPELTEVDLLIGKNVASLIEDRATLQMGIGAIPNAVLAALGNHKDLGVHTEMFSDGIVDLVEKGVITGKYKHTHPGTIVSGFVMGTRKVYDFIDQNPMVRMLDIAYVNNPNVIRKNQRVTAINSCIEVDLLGQVCADSIGHKQYSGVGGQLDFISGASLSENGKPIIALPSTTKHGESRIVPYLKQGASVVTTRAHVHYIVTEYGIADLYGKDIKQRAKALIDIAHPKERENLEKQFFAF